jgi:hypothetical protein
MSPGESYLSLECACGHQVLHWVADLPPAFVMDRHGNVLPEVWSRLRCTACGRRGKPQRISNGWGHREMKMPGQMR